MTIKDKFTHWNWSCPRSIWSDHHFLHIFQHLHCLRPCCHSTTRINGSSVGATVGSKIFSMATSQWPPRRTAEKVSEFSSEIQICLVCPMRNKHKLSTNWYTRQACCEVHLFLTQELRKNGKSGLDGIRHFAKESVDESDYHYLIRCYAPATDCLWRRLSWPERNLVLPVPSQSISSLWPCVVFKRIGGDMTNIKNHKVWQFVSG